MTIDRARSPVVLAREPGIKAREAESLSLALADRYVTLLGDLAPEEWSAVTSCDPWTVKDVSAHLLGWADALCSPRAMGAQARAAFARRKRFGGIVDAQNDAQVEAARSQPPDEVLARLRVMLPRAARLRRRIGGALHYVPAYTSFLGGAINLVYLMNVIYPRVHTLDVAYATGRDPALGAAGERVVADMLKDWARRHYVDATLSLGGRGGGVFVAGAGRRATIAADAAAFAWRLAGRTPATPIELDGDTAAAETWIGGGCPV
jgi:uncharacterized protein (TIGR03083 family)